MTPYPIYYVGKIVSMHGYKGHLVLSQGIENEYIGEYLFVQIDKKGVPFFIEEIKGDNIVKLRYVNSEIDAKKLVGFEYGFETKEEQFTPTSYAEFILLDTLTGNTLQIVDMEEYPQGAMWICNYKNEEVLVPAVEDWIKDINWDTKLIKLELPEGLVEW